MTAKRIGAAILGAVMMFSAGVGAGGQGYAGAAAVAGAAETKAVENVGRGNRIYFAGPMFNHAEKEFNRKITELLESYGYQVFLPQRDGVEGALLEGKTEEELVSIIFTLDDSEVRKADIVFVNLDGRVPDEGACVELGLAYGLGKRCYGFKTDTRATESVMELNPMISGCMIRIFKNHDGDKLIGEIRQYLSQNKL